MKRLITIVFALIALQCSAQEHELLTSFRYYDTVYTDTVWHFDDVGNMGVYHTLFTENVYFNRYNPNDRRCILSSSLNANHFMGKLVCQHSDFHSDIVHTNNKFGYKTYFDYCQYYGDIQCYKNRYHTEIRYRHSTVYGNAYFTKCSFYGKAKFEDIDFRKDVSFKGSAVYGQLNFTETVFAGKTLDLSDMYISDSAYICFNGTKLPPVLDMRGTNNRSKIDLSTADTTRYTLLLLDYPGSTPKIHSNIHLIHFIDTLKMQRVR